MGSILVHACVQRGASLATWPDSTKKRLLTAATADREAEAARKAELARKKAEREALLAEEEKSTPGRVAPKKAKSAAKKTSAPARGLDLAQLDDDGSAGGSKTLAALNASGIDNALDALSLDHDGAAGTAGLIDRHPERRFKAAYAAFEERRLAEMDADGTSKGLRLNQRKDKIRKEFEKSPDNPFNQVTARYDSTRDDLADIRSQEKDKVEQRLRS